MQNKLNILIEKKRVYEKKNTTCVFKQQKSPKQVGGKNKTHYFFFDLIND